MQISSTSHTSPASIPLSLQSSRSRSNEDGSISAVGPQTVPQEYIPPSLSKAPSEVNLDAGTEKKLDRIKQVQTAFKAALEITNTIEGNYLLDPII